MEKPIRYRCRRGPGHRGSAVSRRSRSEPPRPRRLQSSTTNTSTWRL